jgi:hypothetical protein
MSTKDQLLYSALHGTAMRFAAEGRNLTASIVELREMADGRNDVLAEAAGITAGSWYASPSTRVGHELIAAGMLILAGGGSGQPVDRQIGIRWDPTPAQPRAVSGFVVTHKRRVKRGIAFSAIVWSIHRSAHRCKGEVNLRAREEPAAERGLRRAVMKPAA